MVDTVNFEIGGYTILVRKGETSIAQTAINGIVDFMAMPNMRMKTMIDAGANIGAMSFYCASKGFSSIVSIEPSVMSVALMMESIARNGLDGIITPLQMAMDAQSGSVVPLQICGPNSGQNSLFSGDKDLPPENMVRTISLEDTINLFGGDQIDYLKMDIEGGEWKVFSGNLSFLDKVQFIELELHPEGPAKKHFLDNVGVGERIERIKTIIKDSGFDVVYRDRHYTLLCERRRKHAA